MAKYNAALSRDVSQLGDDFFRAIWGYIVFFWSCFVALGESFLRFLDVFFHAFWGCIVVLWSYFVLGWNFFHDIPDYIFSFIRFLGAQVLAAFGEFSGEKLIAGVYHQWEVWSANESARIAFTIFAYFFVSFATATIIFKLCQRIFAIALFQGEDENLRKVNDEWMYCMLVGIYSYGAIAVYNHFGLIAFFVVTGIYLTLLQVFNRIATLNTWMLIDETYDGYKVAVPALVIHTIVYLSSSFEFVYTQGFLRRSVIAHQNVFPSVCPIADAKLSSWSVFIYFCFFEVFSGFVFRFLMRYVHLPEHRWRRLFVPWIYATLMAAGQHMFGVHGAHPGIISGRILPCWIVMGFVEGCCLWVVNAMGCQYLGWLWARDIENGTFRIGSIYRQLQWETQDRQENEQRNGNMMQEIQNDEPGGGNIAQRNQNAPRGGGNNAQRGQNAPRGGGNNVQRGQNAPRGGGNNVQGGQNAPPGGGNNAQRGQNAPRGGGNIAQRVQNNGRNNRRGGRR